MSGPVSLRAAQIYLGELAGMMFDCPSNVDRDLLVYLANSIVSGGSVSFSGDKRKPTLEFLQRFDCWLVIKPYTHSDEKITGGKMKQIIKAWDVLQKLQS